jgi:hypothetical protein
MMIGLINKVYLENFKTLGIRINPVNLDIVLYNYMEETPTLEHFAQLVP